MSALSAADLAVANVHAIFGEADTAKRDAAIAELWVASEDAVFVDPRGTYRGHKAISDFCGGLWPEGQTGWGFVIIGEVDTIQAPGTEGGYNVSRLHWGFGPTGQPPVVTGEDVVTIKDGKIERCYVFMNV